MNDVVLEILPTGNGRLLYDERIELKRLGRLKLRRASHILFRSRKQDFMVRLCEGGRMGPFDSRTTAIDHEIAFLQGRMLSREKRPPAGRSDKARGRRSRDTVSPQRRRDG